MLFLLLACCKDDSESYFPLNEKKKNGLIKLQSHLKSINQQFIKK